MSDSPRIPKAILDAQRQVMELQRSAFTSSFKAINTVQERQEELLEKTLDQVPGLPSEAREAVDAWVSAFRSSRAQYLDAAEKGFDLFQDLIDRVAGDDSSADSSADSKDSADTEAKT